MGSILDDMDDGQFGDEADDAANNGVVAEEGAGSGDADALDDEADINASDAVDEAAQEEEVTDQIKSSSPPAGFVPVKAVQDLRQKNRDLEAQVLAVRREYDPAFKAPEKDDPGYEAYQESLRAQERVNSNLNASERYARRTYGEEKVDTVKDWFETLANSNPQRAGEILTSDDPYEEAIKAYDATHAEQTELEEFRAWKAAKANGGEPPVAPPPAPPAPKVMTPSEQKAAQAAADQARNAPPKTLATARDAGNGGKGKPAEKTGAGTAFDDAFDN